MATYDDNIQQAARKRLGLAGAINGTDDTSQAIYRPKPASNAADIAALNDTMTDVNTPGSPNSPLNAAPAAPATAYSRGQATGQAINAGATAAGGVLQRMAQATFRPAMSIAAPVAQFARGVVGADPDKPLLSPISSAAAATPNNAPLTRTQLPTMTATAPSISAPPGPDRVAAGRTFGTRMADGSTGFSNVPGSVGYDPGYNNAGNNIGIAPAAAPAAAPSLPGQFTRPANNTADATADAAQTANSNLTSILNRDPRSALGIAARNAQVDANSTFGSQRQRTAAYQQAIGGLVGQVGENYKGSLQNTDEIQRGQNELANTDLRNQGELARENVRSIAEFNKPQYETGADGNLVRVTGASATPVTGADKTPLAVQGKINGAYEAAASRHAAELIKAGVDPDEAEQRGLDFAQRVRSGQTGQPAAAAVGQSQKFQDGKIYKDGNGNKAKYVNGKWEPVA